jgi:hypothetical protein
MGLNEKARFERRIKLKEVPEAGDVEVDFSVGRYSY